MFVFLFRSWRSTQCCWLYSDIVAPSLWHKWFVLLVQQRLGAILEPLFMSKSCFSDCQNRRKGFQMRHCPWTSPGSAVIEKGDLFTFSGPPCFILYLYSCDICQCIQRWPEPCLAPQVEPSSTFLVTTVCVLVILSICYRSHVLVIWHLCKTTTQLVIRNSTERSILHNNSVFWLHPLSCVCVVHRIDYSNTAQRSEVTQTVLPSLCVSVSASSKTNEQTHISAVSQHHRPSSWEVFLSLHKSSFFKSIYSLRTCFFSNSVQHLSCILPLGAILITTWCSLIISQR